MTGTVETGSSTTQSNSPAVRKLTDTLASGIQRLYQPGGTSYVAPGATTTGAQASALDAANNPAFASGLAGAIDSYGNRAAGNELGLDDPLYAQQRARLTDDVLTSTNGAFNSSGLFGSDQNQTAAARGLAEGLGGLDLSQRSESYNRQAEAAGMLPGLFSALQMPSSVAAGVGAAQDADAAAQKNGPLDYLSKLLGLTGAASNVAGTTTKEETPWWKIALGAASTAAGAK